MNDRLDPRITAVLHAARFTVWRHDWVVAEHLFTRAQTLMHQIPGAQ